MAYNEDYLGKRPADFFGVVQSALEAQSSAGRCPTPSLEMHSLSPQAESGQPYPPASTGPGEKESPPPDAPDPEGVRPPPLGQDQGSTTTTTGKRFKQAYRTVHHTTLEFLGLTDDWTDTHQGRWQNQRLRLADRQADGKDSTAKKEIDERKLEAKKNWRTLKREARRLVRSRDEGDGVDADIPDATDYPTSDDESEEEPQKESVASITWGALRAAAKFKAEIRPPPSYAENYAELSKKDYDHLGDVPDAVPAVQVPPPPSYRQPRHRPVPRIEKEITTKGFRSWLWGLKKRARQGDHFDDARPFFTYWITTVHVVVLLLSMTLYPLAPMGYGLKNISGEVLTTSLSHEIVEYEEPANLFIGPRQSALVALGAKYTPCMRRDATVKEGITRQRELEAITGCCIRHDQSGCVQTTDEQCSARLSRYDKWSTDFPGPDGRLSGPVCGQDPRFCNAPASVAPNVWADNIIEWPICLSSNTSAAETASAAIRRDTSYTCELIGRPCCVGIHGECHITTREHCDFLHGTFHDEATLCSQVSCLSDVCRMLPFLNPEVPDQFYRLWVSIFIHPGLLPFFLTFSLHCFLLRNLEKFAGTVRMTIIYITSGVAGNLASAIFVPYRPEAGPSGSLAGIVACLFVIFIVDVKDDFRSHWLVAIKWLLFLIVCFVIGLFPGVDNYAIIFGFVMGMLLSSLLLPHVGHGKSDDLTDSGGRDKNYRRCVVVMVALSLSVALLVTLFMLLYMVPIDCKWCGYLDCVPITPDFCAEQQTSFERHRIIT